MQTSLLNTVPVDFNLPPAMHSLRAGRVTSPFDPRRADEVEEYRAYIERCLKTWTVDVLLDTGQYLSAVRVMQVQGNGREGLRRMPRFPRFIPDQEVELGDEVIVAFLNGQPLAPIVIGTLAPPRNSLADFDTLSGQYATTTDENEWQDRHDYLDTSKPKTLGSHTATRDSGINREQEHFVDTWVNDIQLHSHVLEKDAKARTLEYEHYVQTGETTASSVRTTNENATNLRSLQVVKQEAGTNKLTLESLEAKVLSLSLEVETLGKLLVKATEGKQLLVQQSTDDATFTMAVSNPSKSMGVLMQDKTAGTTAGLNVAAEGLTTLKRVTSDGKQSEFFLDKDGSVLIRSAEGSTVLLDQGELVVTSGKSTVHVKDDGGVTLTAAGGTMVTVQDDAVMLTAPAVTLAAEMVHLQGQVVVGSGLPSGLQGFVPDTEQLYQKLARLADDVMNLTVWATTHMHPSAPPGPPTPPAVPPAFPSLLSPQILASVVPDSLKSFRGE